MNKLIRAIERLLTYIAIFYIDFVYKTSRIKASGEFNLLNSEEKEKFILGFWHGESFSLYPFLKGYSLYVITTENTRGDYITLICNYFGYKTIRVPDESVGGNFLFKIRKEINGEEKGNLALTLDGPLGPYHEPKTFPFITALLTKRRLLPLTIKFKRKINLRNRWDNFTIPLPFNKIDVHFYPPIKVIKKELDNDAKELRNSTKAIMESN
jgi:lysophospholipid acyltransferase (LPLAT)-like uncharacterized protein